MKYEYSTKDFVTAVVLKLQDYKLTRMVRDGKEITFFFESDSDEDIKETLDLYWAGYLEAPIKDVIEMEKEMKTRIYTLP